MTLFIEKAHNSSVVNLFLKRVSLVLHKMFFNFHWISS